MTIHEHRPPPIRMIPQYIYEISIRDLLCVQQQEPTIEGLSVQRNDAGEPILLLILLLLLRQLTERKVELLHPLRQQICSWSNSKQNISFILGCWKSVLLMFKCQFAITTTNLRAATVQIIWER